MGVLSRIAEVGSPRAREFHFGPLAERLPEWQQLIAQTGDATLYHSRLWLDLLRNSYRFELFIALLTDHGTPQAASVFARSRTLPRTRYIALPFSDRCPPLALNEESRCELMEALVTTKGLPGSFEVRGLSAAPPWRIVHNFFYCTIDLDRPWPEIERAADRNFRRNVRRGEQAAITIECAGGIEGIDRFYALQLETRRRLGVPPQPRRFFVEVQRLFDAERRIQTWVASKDGRDLASVVLLRDGVDIHGKWAARLDDAPTGANHVLFRAILENLAGTARRLDLGRCDSRNEGLNRFKREMGATQHPLPYAFYPKVPLQVSSEAMSGPHKLVSRLWRHLPLAATRAMGAALYRYLA